MPMTTLEGEIRDGKVVVDGRIDWPDGTVVRVTPDGVNDDDGPMTPDEIARVLAAMQRPRNWRIPPAVEAEIAAWEKECERHGMGRDAEDSTGGPE